VAVQSIQRAGKHRIVTRVRSHHDPAPGITRVITRVIKKRRKRPRPTVIHSIGHNEDAYVAVAGTPGHGSVHVVEQVPALRGTKVRVVNGVRTVTTPGHVPVVVDHNVQPVIVPHQPKVVVKQPTAVAIQPVPVRPVIQPVITPQVASPLRPQATSETLPLPKCSYINTDFPGDDLVLETGDNARPGINAGSARACKARCRLEETCSFWTYKEGLNRDLGLRDCFLKIGTPGLPVPREAVPRLGFVSGTKDNNCVCIESEDEEDQVCPIKEPRGAIYPWRSLNEDDQQLDEGLGLDGGLYAGLTPRIGLGTGNDNTLVATVRALRAQLDLISTRLGGTNRIPGTRDL